jgi:hypothetical protein
MEKEASTFREKPNPVTTMLTKTAPNEALQGDAPQAARP